MCCGVLIRARLEGLLHPVGRRRSTKPIPGLGVKTEAAYSALSKTRVRFPNGTRSNLQNSSTRFHCTLISSGTAPWPLVGESRRGIDSPGQRHIGPGDLDLVHAVLPSASPGVLSFGGRPLVGLHASDQRVVAVSVGLEDRRLSLLHLEPVLTKRVDDVRLVGDDQRVRARIRYCGDDGPKRPRPAVVLVWADYLAAFGHVGCSLGLLSADQPGRLHGPVEPTRVRFADRHPSGFEYFTNRLCISAALVIQLALLGDVPLVQWIRVRLLWMRGTVSNHDNVATGAKHLQDVINRWGRLSPGWRDDETDNQ